LQAAPPYEDFIARCPPLTLAFGGF